jgi:hypothetical protein
LESCLIFTGVGDYLYFISATDHQIYRTMGRNASDVELVDIQVPQYKSKYVYYFLAIIREWHLSDCLLNLNSVFLIQSLFCSLFVFDNKVIFDGISFDGTNWLRDGGHWVWSPGSTDAVDFGLGTDMDSFCGSDRCEVASYASGGDYLIVSRYSSSAGRFKTSYTSRPSFSAPTSWVLGEDDPNAVIEAYPMRDVVCAAKRVRMLCQSNSTLYAKAYLYSGPGILINDTHMLLHFVTEYTTNLQTQIFRITTDVMNSGSHLNQPDLSFGVPPGATSYGDESTILRTGRWARLSPTMFLSDWPTDLDGVNVMRTFDISTRTFGNVTFSQPVIQFEIISSEQLGSSATVYVAGRSPSREWSLFKITIAGSTVATNRVPALFTFPDGVPVASAVIVDRNDPSLIYFSGNTSLVGVTQLFSYNPSTGQRTEVPAPNYGNQGSVNVSNPFIQVWPFKAPGNASRQGLVDYAAVVVRTYDEITKEYKLTLITGWTHPDDRCDISTETTAAGVTYHYARDVVEVVAAVNYAVLVIYDPTKAYPIRKIISRTCEPRVTMAIPPLFQESDRADSRFVSDVWCGDVLFFKGYVPIDSSRGDFKIISYHPDAGLASKSIQRNNVNYTNTYPLEIMDRRVVVSCLQSRQALVSHPSADRLRMTLFDRSRLSNINYDYVDDDSSVRDTLVTDASVRPAELVGRINNVLIFINGGHHIFGLRIGSNPSILRVNYSFPTAPTPPSWGYLPRSHPVRWLTLKNSAWYFHRDNHYVFRLHINDAGTTLSAYQAINVHNDPFVVQTVQLPADWGVMIVTPYSPKTEFYVCPYNYFAAECWESAYTADFRSVRFMFTFNDTLYWSEGASPYDEQGTKLRSVYIDRTSPPETQWPNVQEFALSSQIPWAYSTVGLPDYSSSMWISNGVRIMLLRTAFGVELVAAGPSLAPPLPRDIGLNSPLVYPIRIPPVPTCPGLPPQGTPNLFFPFPIYCHI